MTRRVSISRRTPALLTALAVAAGALVSLHASPHAAAAEPAAFVEAATESAGYGDVFGASVIDLAGQWQFKKAAFTAGDANTTLAETVLLPGTMATNGKGTANTSTASSPVARFTHVGPALYQKVVAIPADWSSQQVTLSMEHTKTTRVWVNGVEQTSFNTATSLTAAHEYYLSGLTPGTNNVITIEVNNTRQFGAGAQMTGDEVQTNWNGVVGKIQLIADAQAAIRDVRVYPNVDDKEAEVRVDVANASASVVSVPSVEIAARSYNSDDPAHSVAAFEGEGGTIDPGAVRTFSYTVPMGDDVRLWSEWDPTLYSLTATAGTSTFETSFGMREFSVGGASSQHFTINDDVTMLRGNVLNAHFPLQGYAWMQKDKWVGYLSTLQTLGLNFIRFHSWTPPEAAFQAADELGMYLQPELYQHSGRLTDFLAAHQTEAAEILKTLANHPSFVAMSFGNEMNSTGTVREAANTLHATLEDIDPTRLYSEGTNNNFNRPSLNTSDDYWGTGQTGKGDVRAAFSYGDRAGGGALETSSPNSTMTYENSLAGFGLPIMSHEAGQFQVYPEFEQLAGKYDGTFVDEGGVTRQSAINHNGMEYYGAKVRSAGRGLAAQQREFAAVSGRIASTAYKAEWEMALRTGNLAGYQTMSIENIGWGTAPIGIFDDFMDEKVGTLTPEQMKQGGSAVTILGKLPTFTYTNDQHLTPTIAVANYSADDIANGSIAWTLTPEKVSLIDGDVAIERGEVLASGSVPAVNVSQGATSDVATLDIPLAAVTTPQKLVLRLSGSKGLDSTNEYSIWVYPAQSTPTAPPNVLVTRTLDAVAEQRLAEGGRVLLIPDVSTTSQSVQVGWRTDFYNTQFHLTANYDHPLRSGSDSTGTPYTEEEAYTMGTLLDDAHPAFASFPTEFWSDWQWHDLVKEGRGLILDDHVDLPLIAQPIDHYNRNHRLGTMFEATVGGGSLFVSTYPLLDDDSLEARQLYSSVLSYVGGEEFAPTYEGLTASELNDILGPLADVTDPYSLREAESYDAASRVMPLYSGYTFEGQSTTVFANVRNTDYATYQGLDFSTSGTESITIRAAVGGTAGGTYNLVLRDGAANGSIIATLPFKIVSTNWGGINEQTFTIPRLTGVHDLTFSFTGGISFDAFSFAELDTTDPYVATDPKLAAGITLDSEGASVDVRQNGAFVRGAVTFPYSAGTFGDDGATALEVTGDTTAPVPVTISYGDGKSAQLVLQPAVGVPAGDEFVQTLVLPERLSGLTDYSISVAVPQDEVLTVTSWRFVRDIEEHALVAVPTPASVEAAYGSARETLATLLPQRSVVQTDQGNASAAVEWDIAALPETLTNNTQVTGTVILPGGVSNPAGVSLAITTTVAVTGAPSLKVGATVSARCVSGRVVLAVTVTNAGDEIADVGLSGVYGQKTLTGLAAGASRSQAFTTRQTSVAAGEIAVRATSGAFTEEQLATTPAQSC